MPSRIPGQPSRRLKASRAKRYRNRDATDSDTRPNSRTHVRNASINKKRLSVEAQDNAPNVWSLRRPR
eukprot:11577355-Alexandrium_andersonii.AAC.1